MSRKRIGNSIVRLVAVLCLVPLLVMVFGVATGRVVMPMNRLEQAVYLPQSWGVYVAGAALLLVLYAMRAHLARWSSWKLYLLCSLVYLLGAVYLILHVDAQARADAGAMISIAKAFNQGNYDNLVTPGAYLYSYPHQLGLLSWNRIFLSLSTSPRILFGVNALLVISIQFFQWQLADMLFANKLANNLTILLSYLFLPSFFFILFAYGQLPGLFFLMMGLYFYVIGEKKEVKHWQFLTWICLALASLLRTNYLIFTIAFLVMLVLNILQTYKKSDFLSLLGVLLCTWGVGKAHDAYYQGLIEQPLPQGAPKIAYVTMGLRDQSLTPGYFDNYVIEVYQKEGFSTSQAAQVAQQELLERLRVYRQDLTYAGKFFKAKLLATWGEPTYQSIWSGPLEDIGQKAYTQLLKSIYGGGSGYRWINQFLSAMQLLLYGFASLFLLRRLRQKKILAVQLYPFIYLLGGVLFHLAWETKSQYVYVYVLLLIPFVAQTIAETVGKKGK